MTVAAATKVQNETAARAVAKLSIALQQFLQGSVTSGKVPTATASSVQALVVAANAALVPLT